jgi:zinc-binding alcohol dehydrogenase/oxidoreductase
MATAFGCKVYVTSSSEEKIQSALKLGASGGFNYRNSEWVKNALNEACGFDVIIDSAGGNGFADLTEVANPAARLVLFGRTAGNVNNLRPGVVYNKQLHIMGSVMGSPKDFENLLSFYSKHELHPVIHKTFDLKNAAEAFEYMDGGQHFGKITIKII